jgi:hypothetical protein
MTPRQRLILLAVLSYAYSNTSEMNEAMAVGDDGYHILVGESVIAPITENEIDELMATI